MQSIQISDVGPIERLEIPVPTDGGVCVLRGRNGSGKSTALEAVQALAGTPTKLTSRDAARGTGGRSAGFGG